MSIQKTKKKSAGMDCNVCMVMCPICKSVFALVWDSPIRNTLFVRYSDNDGVYGVYIKCPNCVFSLNL